jgi:hypothetical protein
MQQHHNITQRHIASNEPRYDTLLAAHAEAATVAEERFMGDKDGGVSASSGSVNAYREASTYALLRSARHSLGLGLASARLHPSNPSRLVFQTVASPPLPQLCCRILCCLLLCSALLISAVHRLMVLWAMWT